MVRFRSSSKQRDELGGELLACFIALFFVFGWFVLIGVDTSVTGAGSFTEDISSDNSNETFEYNFSIPIENVSLNESNEIVIIENITEVNQSEIVILNESINDTGFGFETEAIWYGTSVITSQWGSALEPENLTRTMDDRSVNFVFNATASGIHNWSDWNDYVVGNYWFEKNASDITGRNNGTATAGVTNTTGIVGYAYEFDGSGDYINVSDDDSLDFGTGDFSVSAWIKTTTTDRGGIVFKGKINSHFHLEINGVGAGKLRLGIDDRDDGGANTAFDSDSNTYNDGNWHHVVAVFDRDADGTFYKDGIADGSSSITASDGTIDNTQSLYIGSQQVLLNFFNGTIDEVTIFNRSLSSAEISGIYNASLYGEDRTIENCSLLLSVDGGSYTRNVTGDLVIHNDSNLDEYVVGNWYFEKDGDDESGLGNTAAVFGSISNITGKVGYAYEFDGVVDYVTIADDNSLSFTDGAGTDKPFSVSSWVRMDNAAGFYVFSKLGPSPNKEYGLLTASGAKIYFYLHDEANSASLRIGYNTRLYSYEGQWIHLATTYDGSETTAGMRIYLNGVRVDDLDLSTGSYTGMPNGGTEIKIGQQSGAVDEVIFFNRSLSSAEVNAIYNNSKGVNFEGLNTSWNVEFGYDNHSIDWKIGCYDDLGIQWNTSEMNTELSDTVNMSKPNIGAHAYYDPNYVVGYWRFEENNGSDTFDETGVNNGTLKGDVKWCPDEGDSQKWNCSGRVGKGYLFDGDGDYITSGSKSGLTGDPEITISGWFKRSKTGEGAIAGFGNSGVALEACYLRIDATGDGTLSAEFAGGNRYITTDNLFENNEWHHAVMTKTPGAINTNTKIYLDGVEIASASASTNTPSIIDEEYFIGKFEDATCCDFNGTLDEITIWNRSLSALEIQQLYYSQKEPYNSSYTIQDISASNNNTYDKDNDTIKYIYNWYVNNVSMAVLNMPFEAVNNGSEQNFSKDYSDNANHGVGSFNAQDYDGTSGWNRDGGVDGFGAYEFDGVDDYIDLGTGNNNLSTDFTITFWADYDSSLGAGSKHALDLRGSGSATIAFRFLNNDIFIRSSDASTPTSQPSLGAAAGWHMYSLTFDGSDLISYKDGSQNDQESFTKGIDTTGQWGIGGKLPVTFYGGAIDDVLIFNRSLSAEQILALYKNQTQTIKFTETQKGERWSAEITANDGYGDSIKYNTSELLIDEVTLEIHNVWPENASIVSDINPINFTYNVSDGDSVAGVFNCSLWLGYSSGSLARNKTDDLIEVEMNQTMNITFVENKTHTIYWLIGCYDKEHVQTNSSEGVFTFDRTTVPVMSSSRIRPLSMAYTNQTLVGNCSATDSEGDNVTYYWRWYKDNVLNETGNTSINYTQGTQINVHNVSSVNTTIGEEWILSCMANDGIDNSTRLNSSITIISQELESDGLHSFRVDEFITVSNDSFMLGGSEYLLRGTDSYYLADYATNHTYDDDGHEINNSKEYVTEILNEAQYLDVNVIRTWAGMQGGGRGNTSWNQSKYGGHFNLFENKVPGNFNETMFKALDYVIYEASKRDIRLMLVLVNNWNAYGGMRWYAQQSPTTDKTNENETDSGTDEYWQFHDQFYNDTNCMEWYKNYTNYTLNRVNTYSGKLYKDDPAIFAWMLANEPRAKTDPNGRAELIRNWTINMTAFIKGIDTNHLVGLGIEGWGYQESWGEGTDIFNCTNGTGVDFATYALHPDQWNYFAERSENSSGDWVDEGVSANSTIDFWTNSTGNTYNNKDTGLGGAPEYTPDEGIGGYKDWIRQNIEWADTNLRGMPIILQEMGMYTNQDHTLKDRYYQQAITNFYKTGGDGLLFWTLNHDEYYYSTDTDGDMDDGYGYYLSDDVFLKNKSQSVVDAYDFATSYTRELNFYKYDFIVNPYPRGKHNDSDKDDYVVGNWWFEKDSTDESGLGNDGTISGGVTNTIGIVGYAYEFDAGIGDYVSVADDDSLSFTDGSDNDVGFSISTWIKAGDISSTSLFLKTGTGNNEYSFSILGGDKILFKTFTNTSSNYIGRKYNTATLTAYEGQWVHLAGTYDGSETAGGFRIYVNGVRVDDLDQTGGTYTGMRNWGADVLIGMNLDGDMDEVIIFNRTLSATEIENLYMNQKYGQPPVENITNASLLLNVDSAGWTRDQSNTSTVLKGVNYTFSKQFSSSDEEFYWITQWCDDHDSCYNSSEGYVLLRTAPLITLESPTNDTYFDSGGTKEFNYSVTDTLDISNCQLYVNNLLNKTDTTVTRSVTQSFSVDDFSGTSAVYNWSVKCTDIGDNVGYSANNWTFTIDTVDPAVSLQAPINNTNWSASYINFTYNVSDDISPIDACILWLKKQGSWELNYTETSITKDINQSINITLKDENVLWRVECNDSADNRKNSTTRNITIDTTLPIVNLQYPLNETIFSQADIDFTYNATDSPTQIKNCSLYLGYGTTNINVSNSSDATITMTINQSFDIIFEMANRTIYWKVGCYNDALLQTNSTLRNFILRTSSPRVSEGRGSSSGIGSSAGRFASKITESIATVFGNVYTIDNLVPGETGLEISDPGLSIYKLVLDVNRELENVNLKISEGKTVFVKKPKGRVYRYIIIDTDIFDSAVNKIKIFFKVQKGFGENINLMHYGADWEKLDTKKINDDEWFNYYEAESDSLSIFAITSIEEKKSFVKIFRPGLVVKDQIEEGNFFDRLFGYLGISIISVVGLIFMIMLSIFVRSRLKRKKK